MHEFMKAFFTAFNDRLCLTYIILAKNSGNQPRQSYSQTSILKTPTITREGQKK